MIVYVLGHSDAIREKMKKNYISNPSYNYEQVNRASLACGPMVKWAIAQVSTSQFYLTDMSRYLQVYVILYFVMYITGQQKGITNWSFVFAFYLSTRCPI